jgi:hypothetical protein
MKKFLKKVWDILEAVGEARYKHAKKYGYYY